MLDPSIPRCLMRNFHSAEHCAVVAVETESEPGAFRLGRTSDPKGYLRELRKEDGRTYQCLRLVWLPGVTAANTICNGVQWSLRQTGASFKRSWFRAPLVLLDRFIAEEIGSLRSPSWTHAQFLTLLRAASDREADRVARGEL